MKYEQLRNLPDECAGILDVCQKLQLLDEQKYTRFSFNRQAVVNQNTVFV